MYKLSGSDSKCFLAQWRRRTTAAASTGNRTVKVMSAREGAFLFDFCLVFYLYVYAESKTFVFPMVCERANG
jgi:hypothetical protein